MKNVRAIVLLISMPMIAAAIQSWAVARMAFPSFVPWTKKWSASIMTSDEKITTSCIWPMLTGPRAKKGFGSTCGNGTGDGPIQSCRRFSRLNETPIAVRSGARRCRPRSGRYANRSITIPVVPMISIVARNVTINANAIPAAAMCRVAPRRVSRASATNDPAVYTSPWAKLISSMMPYTIV